MAPPPAKLAPFLGRAERLGLLVRESDDETSTIRAWTVGPDPAERYVSHQLFVYWTPGTRGGRVSFYCYSTWRQRSAKCTRSAAYSWLWTLAPKVPPA